MKKMIMIAGLALAASLADLPEASAQVSISINIGSQPGWGPAGYDYVRFYYFPELNIYYDVDMGLFYISNGRVWKSYRTLPRRFRHYDLYRTYKVVINQDRPWTHNSLHVRDYSRYRNNRSQVAIRDSRDARYSDHSSRSQVGGSNSPGRGSAVRGSGSGTNSRSSGNNSGSSRGSRENSNNNGSRGSNGNSSRGR